MKYKIVHQPQYPTIPYSIYYKTGFIFGEWVLLTSMARSLYEAKQTVIQDILNNKSQQDLENSKQPNIIIDSKNFNIEVNNE